MPQSVACPDVAQYQRLASGRLPDADKDSLLNHLEGCDACARRFSALPEQDALAGLVRQARTLSDAASQETIVRLVERLSKLRPGKAAAEGKTPPPPAAPSPAALLNFVCPACGKGAKVKAELAGKQVRCPHCKAAVSVPAHPPVRPAEDRTSAAAGALGQTGATAPLPANAGNSASYDFLAPPQAPDELGRLGPYRVLEVLGAGGMGVVFRAEDPQLQRQVALKAMLPSLAASDGARQRFLREARLAAAIEHDHIITIHQVGEDRGVPFVAMPLLRGESLEERLKRERSGEAPAPLPLAETLRIGREIAEGLAAAHERGLIHRDIKPANVWLEGKKGRVKILDFGLARQETDAAHLTQSGAILGTPAYMAPEQARAGSADQRCDLFSLGCVLYRMATGAMPFKGVDAISMLMSVTLDDPVPPGESNPALPPALSALVMKLLEKDPQKRVGSARELVQIIRTLEKELPTGLSPAGGVAVRPALTNAPTEIQPRRPGSASPAASPAKFRRKRALLIGAALLAALLGGGVILGQVILRITDKDGKSRDIPLNPGDKLEVVAPAAAPAAPAAPPQWAPLFNGKDLTGWTVVPIANDGNDKGWAVEQGILVAHGADYKSRNFLLSDRDYADFVLRLEFSFDKGGFSSSGIGLRAIPGEKLPAYGTLIQDHPVLKLVGALGKEEETGTSSWVLDGFDVKPDHSADLQAAGSWNRLEIEVKGRTIRVSLNGKRILDATLASGALLSDGSVPALGRTKGRIGLQLHTGAVRFRNIEIKELLPATDKDGKSRDVPLSPGDKKEIIGPAAPATGPSPFDRLRREDIPPELLKAAGRGDPTKAPAEIVAILGKPGRVDGHTFHDDGSVGAIDLRPDGKALALGYNFGWSSRVTIWDAATGKQTVIVPPGSHVDIPVPTFSHDGTLLAVSSGEGDNDIWDVKLKRRWQNLSDKHFRQIGRAFTPDDHGIVIGSPYRGGNDRGDPLSLIPITGRQPPPDPVTFEQADCSVEALALSPDGATVAAAGHFPPSNQMFVKLWDMKTGKVRRTVAGPWGGFAFVAFSPDGKFLLTQQEWGGERPGIVVHDLGTDKAACVYKLHAAQPLNAAFSADGRLAASCDGDGDVHIWDPRSGQNKRVIVLNAPGGTWQIFWTPEGRHLIVLNGNGTVYVLRLAAASGG